MREKNRAEEWFRAKHDELAQTARANLAAHDLEPGQEAYHLNSLHYATAEQMEAICPTGIDFDRYATGRRRGTEATSRRRETERGTDAAHIPGFSFGRPADALIIAARGTRQCPRCETEVSARSHDGTRYYR